MSETVQDSLDVATHGQVHIAIDIVHFIVMSQYMLPVQSVEIS
jgi:hypothetical protein